MEVNFRMSNVRTVAEVDEEWVKLVKNARNSGMSIEEIERLLQCFKKKKEHRSELASSRTA